MGDNGRNKKVGYGWNRPHRHPVTHFRIFPELPDRFVGFPDDVRVPFGAKMLPASVSVT